MLIWLVTMPRAMTMPRAISQLAWLDELKSFKLNIYIEGYAKAFANAFLKNCPGAKLIEETRATLDHLARLPLYHYH